MKDSNKRYVQETLHIKFKTRQRNSKQKEPYWSHSLGKRFKEPNKSIKTLQSIWKTKEIQIRNEG